jgi:hypothetical protein
VKRQPHVTPRYLPPAEPPRESLAMALVGAAAVIGFAVALFAILWALA